jgi:hypothetical protein
MFSTIELSWIHAALKEALKVQGNDWVKPLLARVEEMWYWQEAKDKLQRQQLALMTAWLETNALAYPLIIQSTLI